MNLLINERELLAKLDVTPMTIRNWRAMSDPFPCYAIPINGRRDAARRRLIYPVIHIKGWLARNRPALVGKLDL